MEVIKKVNAPWMLSKAAAFPLDPLPELLVFSRFVRQLPDSALAPSAAHEPILAKKKKQDPYPLRLSNTTAAASATDASEAREPLLLLARLLNSCSLATSAS
jgi:hypothetical protein